MVFRHPAGVRSATTTSQPHRADSREYRIRGAPVAESAHLSPEQRRREAVVFGLRLIEGIDVAALRSGGKDGEVEDEWQRALHRLRDQGLLEERIGWIRLTELGRRWADSVAVGLM